MNEQFELNEKLLRAVLPFDQYWKNDGSITSAAFKDGRGLSVDRLFNRDLQDGIAYMKRHLEGTIVWVTYQTCLEATAIVCYLPNDYNPFHSEIHRDKDIVLLTKSQAKYLATHASIVTETISLT